MADGEDKSLDDFFAKRDKKKKKDRGRKGANEGAPVSSSASSVGPSSAAAPPAAPTPAAAAPVAAAATAVAPSVSATAGGAAAAGGGSSAGGTAPGNAGASGGVQAAASASVKKPKREREKAQRGSENSDSAAVKEEEEWKEFEQKEADYSGLRIQALQISEENVEEEGGLEGKEDKDSDGEGTARDSERSSGVWSRQAGQAQPTAPAAKVAAEALDVKGVVGGVYRPPGARSGSAATPRRGPQKPPEITSESQFPSLQAAAMVETKREKELEKTFETVKHRGRAREDGQRAKGVDLELGNQFAVLGE